jgi:hypothetical protein
MSTSGEDNMSICTSTDDMELEPLVNGRSEINDWRDCLLICASVCIAIYGVIGFVSTMLFIQTNITKYKSPYCETWNASPMCVIDSTFITCMYGGIVGFAWPVMLPLLLLVHA